MRPREHPGGSRFFGDARFDFTDPDFLDLLNLTVSRIPAEVPPLRTVTSIRLRRRGSTIGMVGLTHWRGIQRGDALTDGSQTISFYTDLFNQLSDEAKMAIIGHELAHAWLNEHVRPEKSIQREEDADDLAKRWGLGAEFDALDEEADTI
jgi:hypothetical protein